MQGIRKYPVQDDFFDTWSHDMSYILGLISADGNIYNRTLSIDLHPKDKVLLEYIASHICPSASIENCKEKSARLRINSVILVKSLAKYNILPRKSFNLRLNFNIPDEFFGDYLRGVFDGDGCVFVRRNSIESCIVSASPGYMEDIQDQSQVGGRICTIHRENRSPLYKWSMYTNDTLRMRDLMYKHDGFALPRKRDIFFSSFYVPSPRLWTSEQVDFLMKNIDNPQKWLAKKLNKSVQSISLKKWRLRYAN